MTSVKRHLMLMTWVTDRTVELFIRNKSYRKDMESGKYIYL